MYLILFMLLIASTSSLSQPLYPRYMKGAKIFQEMPDKTQYKFDGEDWMVVNRNRSKKLHNKIAQQIKELEEEIERLKAIEDVPRLKRNRITAHIGYGNNGILGRRFSSGIEVKAREGIVFGATYGFSIDSTFSLSLSVFSTNVYFMGAGLSF